MERVGHNQFRRFDRFALQSEFADSRCHQRRGEPFPQARNRIECARRELPQQGRSFAEPPPFRKHLFRPPPDARAFVFLLDQARQRGFVLLTQRIENSCSLTRVSGLRFLCRLDQPVGHAAHRGNHGDATGFVRGLRDNLCRPGDARCVADGRAPEFHHL